MQYAHPKYIILSLHHCMCLIDQALALPWNSFRCASPG